MYSNALFNKEILVEDVKEINPFSLSALVVNIRKNKKSGNDN